MPFIFRVLFIAYFGFSFPLNVSAQTCNNWLYIPSQPGYIGVGDLDIPGDQITVEAMFMRTTPYSHILYAGDLVSKHSIFSDVNYLLRPGTAEITTTNGYYLTPESCEIELNRIYHVAMVYDGSSLRFYRDGFLISQVAASGDLIQNDWDTRIGLYELAFYPENMIGYVNEVRIWNVARTQQQIRDNMSGSLSSPGTQPGLLAYYTFDNLINKQGNPAWNGTLGGSASINNSIPNCNFIPTRCPEATDTLVINAYTEINSFDECENELQVGSTSEFNIGDTVLIMQMKGASVDSSNSDQFGSISDIGNSGNYEFNYVANISGNRIQLRNKVDRSFDFQDGVVQLIRVPYYENLETSAVLSCLPFDGRKGGVLVFNVANTLTLNEDIDVSGRGFRGGSDPVSSPSSELCYENQFFYPPNPDLASQKGEGVATISVSKSFGKGALANGGGGGNSHNSGGGGGGNASMGGYGGYNYELAPCNTNVPFDNRGMGGKMLPYSNVVNRIFLGGGGGAGHSNNPQGFQAMGGNGGGIVMITAQNLVSFGHTIKANGADGRGCTSADASCHEGMGGGGAGGVVALNVLNYIDSARTSINGGDGADMVTAGQGRLGPGGGGSGGTLWLSQAFVPNDFVFNVSGGSAGVNVAYANDSWGATPGQDGISLFNLSLPYSSLQYEPNIDSVRIAVQQASCSEFNFEGLAYLKSQGVANWHWDFGDGNYANTQLSNHTYANPGDYLVKLVITDAFGCRDSITTQVTSQGYTFNFSYNQDICNPFLVSFSGTGSTENPFWDFGDGTTVSGVTNVDHLFAPGDYEIKYTIGSGICFDTVRSSIHIGLSIEDVIITPDTTICVGDSKMLRAVASNRYCWTPGDFLDDPTSQNPTTSTPSSQLYFLTAEVWGENLIENGDFSSGNTGFDSDYQFSSGSGIPEGTYNVGDNVNAWHGGLAGCTGFNGNGNMLMVNGSATPNAIVWSTVLPVQPFTNYVFSARLQSLSSQNPARLRFSINGRIMGEGLDAPGNTCDWQRFFASWNPGNATTATIAIINSNTVGNGNDFALDDLIFSSVSMKRDSVNIDVNIPEVSASAPPTVCVNTPVQLDASGANSYQWDNAGMLNDPAISNPVATLTDTTTFVVTGVNTFGCTASDTVIINTFPLPDIQVANDTMICRSSSIQLWASGGQTYVWQPAESLNNPGIADPIAVPAATTSYHVDIQDGFGCWFEDSVMVNIRPDAVFTATGPSKICEGDSLQLSASGGDIYLWTPGLAMDDASIATPFVWPSAYTEYSVSIIDTICYQSALLVVPIDVSPKPNVQASRSNDIDCTVNQSILAASGAIQYSWTPGTTLNNPFSASPIATPTVTTTYILEGKSMDGCIGTDSVIVRVEKVNEGDYWMPAAFTPNNDGLNDCYGVKYWGIVEKIEFSIFNRWGERVFYTTDPNGCWDGRYKGVMQNSGVFVYMIRAQTACSESVIRKGTVTLIR
jgi:gliding motility-associated-like protein